MIPFFPPRGQRSVISFGGFIVSAKKPILKRIFWLFSALVIWPLLIGLGFSHLISYGSSTEKEVTNKGKCSLLLVQQVTLGTTHGSKVPVFSRINYAVISSFGAVGL